MTTKLALNGHTVAQCVETLDNAHVSALLDAARSPLRLFLNHGFAQNNRGPFHPREVVGELVARRLVARKKGVRALVATLRGEITLALIEKRPDEA